MNMYITMSIIGLWLIYAIVIKLTKKRKYDYTFIVAFVFLLGFAYFYLDDQMETDYYSYFSYATLALFAIWLVIDNLLLLFKKNVSEFDFKDLEDELAETNSSSELLRQRFISTIELINDGIAFRDGDFIFGTDRFIEITGLENNEFTVERYRSLIHKDDLPQYDMKIEKLSRKYPIYSIKYRVKNNGAYMWISEQGKMIILEKKKSYISTIKTMDIKKYPETDVDVLNTLPDYKNMYAEMQKLSRQKSQYHLVIIQLTNIPKINEKFGRDFGDLLMGEYLSKLRFKFIKDNKSLFRISGIKFGILIKDKSKFDLLDRALVGSGELMTMQLQFGGVSQTVYPNLGISESPFGGKNADVVIEQANEALELTLNDNFETTFCFFDRI